jgi:hypothetical protein
MVYAQWSMLTLNGARNRNEGKICSNQKSKHLPGPENVRSLLKDEAESEPVNLQLSRIQYPTQYPPIGPRPSRKAYAHHVSAYFIPEYH